jgi:hypothetical protein
LGELGLSYFDGQRRISDPNTVGKRGAYLLFVKTLSADDLAPLYRQYGMTAHAAFVAEMT